MILSDVAHGYFLGLTCVITQSKKYVLNQRVGLLRLKADISPFFVSSYLNIHQKYFYKQGQGSSQKNLSKGDILNMPILIPPTLAEQTAIATVLSDMDSEIEALEQKLSKYNNIKQGMMQELLTGRIRLVEEC